MLNNDGVYVVRKTRTGWTGIIIVIAIAFIPMILTKLFLFWLILAALSVLGQLAFINSEFLFIHDNKIVLKGGILSKSTREVLIKDIKVVEVNQNVSDRLYRKGTISISTQGINDIAIVFKQAHQPDKARDYINSKRQ